MWGHEDMFGPKALPSTEIHYKWELEKFSTDSGGLQQSYYDLNHW